MKSKLETVKQEPDYKLPKGGYIWNIMEHNEWGNAINLEWEQLRVYGHISRPRTIKEGDIIHIPMESKQVLSCYMKNVENIRDPKDMFFADLIPIEYAYEFENISELKKERELNSEEFRGMVRYGIKALPGMTIY